MNDNKNRPEETNVAPLNKLAAEDTVDFGKTGNHPSPNPSTAAMRYRVLRSHAKGGLGEVFVAQDTELNRIVALKAIQKQHAGDSASRGRFILEAEVTAWLEHPGIVPIYGFGSRADGRPYYAMRFIRGESLQEAVDRFYRDSASADKRLDASRYDGIQFRGLLRRFVDVCNAIQYAHSRGVLHRDLKPGNVMLGDYGETLVVDWGLAKIQRSADNDSDVNDSDVNDSDVNDGESPLWQLSKNNIKSNSDPTLMGAAIGTPAFMPPEQAAGQIDQFGPQSDVYSLGATLFYMLTGSPPFRGESAAAVLEKVRQAAFPTPREVRPDAPRSLSAICLKAMAGKRTDRYASPKDLADDVERNLADESVIALKDPITVRARRWVRKHQTFTAAAAVVIFMSVIGLGVFSTVVSAKNRELAQANDAERNARLLAEKKEREASENAHTARSQTKLALETLHTVIFDIQRGLENVAGTTSVRRRLLKTALDRLEAISEQFADTNRVDRHTLVALSDMAGVFVQVGVEIEAGGASNQDSSSALSTAERLYQRAFDIAQRLAESDSDDLRAKRDLFLAYNFLGNVYLQIGKVETACDSYLESNKIAQRLSEANPTDPQAIRDLTVSFNKLGLVQRKTGNVQQALEYYQTALEIRQRVAKTDPANAQFQRDLSVCYARIAAVHLEAGAAQKGAEYYRKAYETRRRMVEADPDNDQAQRDLMVVCNKRGELRLEAGAVQEAYDFYRMGFDIAKRLVERDPTVTQAQRDLSISYGKLGDISARKRLTSQAIDDYTKALQINQRIAQADPLDALLQEDLSIQYDRLGDLHRRSGAVKKAGDYYRSALAIRERLAKLDPANARAQQSLTISYDKLGDLSRRVGAPQEAKAHYQSALAIRQQLARLDPANADAQRGRFISRFKIAMAHQEANQWPQAAAEFRRAAEVLSEMINNKQLVQISQRARADMVKRERLVQQLEVAMGDWDGLTKLPADSLPVMLEIRGFEFARRLQFVDASRAAKKIIELGGGDKQRLYNAARILSRCAQSIKTPPRGNLSSQQTRQRSVWINDALDALKQSIAAGWTVSSQMQKDPSFAALRDLPEFKALASKPNGSDKP